MDHLEPPRDPIAKVAVVGSRGFDNFDSLVYECDMFLAAHRLDRIIIISGGAHGADTLAERYARLRGFALEVYRAKWGELGKVAGFVRNVEMAKLATHGIAFWDGSSKGTKQMIYQLRRLHKPTKVVVYTGPAKGFGVG